MSKKQQLKKFQKKNKDKKEITTDQRIAHLVQPIMKSKSAMSALKLALIKTKSNKET